MGIIITIFFIFLLSVNYKRGVIIIAATLQMLSYIGTDIPELKIFTVLSAYALLLYFFIPVNLKKKSERYPKTLLFSSYLFVVSFLISEIYTRTSHHWGTIVSNIITYFLFPFILWKCLDSKKNIKLYITSLYNIMLIALFWGLLEIVFRKNYALTIIDTIFTLEDFAFDDERIRFGLKRCNSIFSYFTTYGVACLFSFTVFFYSKFKYKIKKQWLTLLVMMMPICAFSTGSRAIFLGLFAILLFLCFQEDFKSSKYYKRFWLIVVLLIPVLTTVLSQVYFSMAHSEEYGDGSTAELRELQWGACLPSFLQSPIIGNGRMYIWDVVSQEHSILRGAESIWFSILVDYGILGAIAFVNLLFMCGLSLWRVDRRLICIPIGYLLVLSLSPDSGVQYNILITFTIIHIKMYNLLKPSNSYYGLNR